MSSSNTIGMVCFSFSARASQWPRLGLRSRRGRPIIWSAARENNRSAAGLTSEITPVRSVAMRASATARNTISACRKSAADWVTIHYILYRFFNSADYPLTRPLLESNKAMHTQQGSLGDDFRTLIDVALVEARQRFLVGF